MILGRADVVQPDEYPAHRVQGLRTIRKESGKVGFSKPFGVLQSHKRK
jgi:hypothetical protein